MVEFTYQMLLSTLQTLGLLVGIFYYVTTLRNAQKTRELTLKAQEQALETRQAQLFTNLYDTYRSIEFRNQWLEVMNLEWQDYEDFIDKYSNPIKPQFASWQSVVSFYEGLGVLVKRKMIDIKFIDDLLNPSLLWAWEKNLPLVKGFRKASAPWEHQMLSARARGRLESGMENPRIYINFEYLYNELMKYLDEHPELKT